MITVNSTINLTNQAVPPIIPVVQGDTGRAIAFTLADFTIPAGATATYYVQKPSGEAVYNSAEISGNTVTVELTAQSIIEVGENNLQVRVILDESVVTSFDVILMVRPFRGIGAVESETEMNIFDKAVEQATEEIEAAAQEAEEYISQAIDDTLTIAGKAADAKTTGDAINDLRTDLEELEPISEDIKVALLACFEHVAWIDEHGQDYYDDLESALYPNTGLVSISAVFTQGSAVIYPSTPLNDLKTYLVVTGYYNDGTSKAITDYSLSGTLEVGTSIITVTKEGKTATFTVTVSAPYWDYEWDASSKTLPTYMTADYYDFTTESGAMFAKKPVLDFDYIGNCKLQIEMKVYSENENGRFMFGNTNNPQILIKNAVVDTNQFRGIKIIMDSALGTSSDHGMSAVSVNGTNSLIPESNSNAYHLYELTAENNFYTVTIDETPVTITQNTNTSAYYGRTGITTSAYQTPPGFYGAFIKSIKFKRL